MHHNVSVLSVLILWFLLVLVTTVGIRLLSQEAAPETKNDETYHSIIKDNEKATGKSYLQSKIG